MTTNASVPRNRPRPHNARRPVGRAPHIPAGFDRPLVAEDIPDLTKAGYVLAVDPQATWRGRRNVDAVWLIREYWRMRDLGSGRLAWPATGPAPVWPLVNLRLTACAAWYPYGGKGTGPTPCADHVRAHLSLSDDRLANLINETRSVWLVKP